MKIKIEIKPTKKDWVYIGSFLLLLGISMSALVFSLSDINCKFLEFSTTKFRDIISVLVSVIAIVITAYLVVLAVSAYGRIEKIERIQRKVDLISQRIDLKHQNISQKLTDIENKERNIIQREQEIQQKLTDIENKEANIIKIEQEIQQKGEEIDNHFTQQRKEFAIALFNFNDEQIQIADESGNIEWKNKSFIRRARMAYNPCLDIELRITLLFQVASVGDITDIPKTEKIIESEQGDIKEAAELTLEELKRRLEIS